MHLLHYALPFYEPIQLKQGLFTAREGLILTDPKDPGKRCAEVAPFPGLSAESLKDCVQAFQQKSPPPPALAWGLHLIHQPLPLPPRGTCLTVNALLSSKSADTVLAQAQDRYAEGYRSFKLKVGFGTILEDLRLIDRLLNSFSGISLRLDANRSWTLTTALNFAAQLPETGIDYLEEPLQHPKDSQFWRSHSAQRLALDESLSSDLWQSYASAADILVVKPMLLGPKRLQKVLQHAKRHHQQVVVSSVFESGLGLRALAQLAYAHAPEVPAGLDTWRNFREDLTDPPFQTQASKVIFSGNMFTDPPDLRLKWVHSI